ncbi:hypothetical protein FACS1894218_4410 [Bacilli bacterium]|nr:hypothetical protein FACS1894218_4410 [Bacilli bacterium]
MRAKAIEKKCNSIQFGDEVTNIANSVFNAKTSFNETSPLQTIKFTGEKSVSIGNSAFANNLSIYKITSSGSTLDFTSIGTGAFAYCYNLQGFAVSTTITAINNYVSNNGASRPFYRCKLTYDGVNNIQSITSTGAGLLRKVNFSNGTYGLGVAFSYSAGSYYRPACGLLAGYIVMTGLTSGGSSHANDWTYHNGITVLDCGTFNGCNY